MRDTGDDISSSDEEALEQRMLRNGGYSNLSKSYGSATEAGRSGQRRERRDYYRDYNRRRRIRRLQKTVDMSTLSAAVRCPVLEAKDGCGS